MRVDLFSISEAAAMLGTNRQIISNVLYLGYLEDKSTIIGGRRLLDLSFIEEIGSELDRRGYKRELQTELPTESV